MNQSKNPRNAGRKKGTPTKSKTFRIHSYLLDFLATKKNQNEYINTLIRNDIRIEELFEDFLL